MIKTRKVSSYFLISLFFILINNIKADDEIPNDYARLYGELVIAHIEISNQVCGDFGDHYKKTQEKIVLLAKSLDVNNPYALTIAIASKELKHVKNLLKEGASLTMPDTGTLLHFAAVHSSPSIIAFLINQGLDINGIGDGKEFMFDANGSPLLDAVANNNTANAKWLIDNGADVNLSNNNGGTPLLMAIYCQNIEIEKYLIKNGALFTPEVNELLNKLRIVQ